MKVFAYGRLHFLRGTVAGDPTFSSTPIHSYMTFIQPYISIPNDPFKDMPRLNAPQTLSNGKKTEALKLQPRPLGEFPVTSRLL